jgi:hypothetical protein
MALPDPTFHAGDVLIRHAGNRRWEQLPPAQPAVTPSGRGMGVLELAESCPAHAATSPAPDVRQPT